MNVLIIGGSGFVSGTLARVALAEGHAVWAVTRGQRPVPEGVTALTADRHEEGALERAVGEAGVSWDLAVDCIGFQPADVRQDVAALRERAAHFAFVSTDWVFDPARRNATRSALAPEARTCLAYAAWRRGVGRFRSMAWVTKSTKLRRCCAQVAPRLASTSQVALPRSVRLPHESFRAITAGRS